MATKGSMPHDLRKMRDFYAGVRSATRIVFLESWISNSDKVFAVFRP